MVVDFAHLHEPSVHLWLLGGYCGGSVDLMHFCLAWIEVLLLRYLVVIVLRSRCFIKLFKLEVDTWRLLKVPHVDLGCLCCCSWSPRSF